MELRFLPERGRRISKPERRSSRTFMRSGSVSIRTRRYESTLAVFRLTEVMEKAVFKEEKPTKPGDKNQKPYSKLLILLYDGIKLTVGVQKTTQEKVQYCLTALGSVSK